MELFVVGNLDVKPASVLDCLVIDVSAIVVVGGVRIVTRLLRHREWFTMTRTSENVLIGEHCARHFWLCWFRLCCLRRFGKELAVRNRVFFDLFLRHFGFGFWSFWLTVYDLAGLASLE